MSESDDIVDTRRTRWMVRLSLLAALGIFLVALLIIYLSYITVPETNCSVYVHGRPDLDGYNVRVERLGSAAASGAPKLLTDTINERNGYTARFFLPSGTYRIEVWDEDLQLLFSQTHFLAPGLRLSMDLNKLFPEPAKNANAPLLPR
jgi:hypothetical protein